MKLKFWEKDKKPEDAPSEVELTNSSKVEVEPGKEETLENVIKGFQAEQARKAALANAAKAPGLEDMIDVDGKKVPLKEVIAGHKEHLKNEQENSMLKDHEDGKHKDKRMEGCGKCSNELANEKALEEATKKAEAAKLENEKAEAEKKRLEALRNAKDKGNAPKMPAAPGGVEDAIKAGNERYGVLATN